MSIKNPYLLKSRFAGIGAAFMLLSLFMWQPAMAQSIPKKAQKYFDEARYEIGLNEFESAEEKLLLALKSHPEFALARMYLGDIYFQKNDFDQALEQYTRVYNGGDYPGRLPWFLAQCAFQLQNFDAALRWVNEYLERDKISQRARNEATLFKANALFSKKAMTSPREFHPNNLGAEVNSPDHEYLAMLNADETTVIYTRLINGQEDLYLTARVGDDWLPSKPLDEETINTGHNEGAHCISADGKTLLYTICNERFTKGSCDLYISHKRNGSWTPPKNLGFPLNSVHWDSQPSLSADGRTIYFVSNRSGGYGGFDLYASEYGANGWSEPVNLGDQINTPFDEQTPFIHFDNQTLYFSSNGHPGMGGQDNFFARKVNGAWTSPVNLGFPINTPDMESGLSITLDGRKGLYAAEREEGQGGMDIYEFDVPEDARPKRVTYVKAKIIDSQTGKPVDADFHLKNLTGEGGSIQSTAVDGEFLICLPSGDNYSLHVKDQGYVFESFHFSLKDTVRRTATVLEIEIDPVQVGDIFVLQNVFFETDSYELLPASEGELNELVELLENYPEVKLEIGGHTDNTGERQYNMVLSKQRAQSVVDYLVENNIDPERLTAQGYGPDQPIATNETMEGQAANRRTEFKIME